MQVRIHVDDGTASRSVTQFRRWSRDAVRANPARPERDVDSPDGELGVRRRLPRAQGFWRTGIDEVVFETDGV